MIEQPLVTICVPVYNGEKFLDECLNSVHRQTYQNWECIVNNNCSSDGTLEIANRYKQLDNRIKVYENDVFVGAVANWNKTFSYANKEARYFKMLQADDWMFPEFIEKMVAQFESNPSVGLCSSFRIDSIKVFPENYNIYDGQFFLGKDMLVKHLLHQFDLVGNISSIMFSMACLKKIERFPLIFDPHSYHIDSELDYEIMNMADVAFVPQILIYRRRHAESGTSTVVFKNRTLLQHYEKILYQYRHLSPLLELEYKKVRLEYAYFILACKLSGKKKVLAWHNNYLVRNFTSSEYLQGVLKYNPLTGFLKRIGKKLLQILGKITR